MFSFLSRLRLPSSSTQPQDDGDDTSSLGRSLNLPWPVTESSSRRPATATAPKREWTSNHSLSLSHGSGSGINISHPIPRTTPNSLTGFDEFPMPPSGPIYGDGGSVYAHGRPVRAGPQQPTSVPGAWSEAEKSRALYPRSQASTQSQAPYAPPEVVRLDSGTLLDESEDESEIEGANPPPRHQYEYTSHPSASSYALPYPYPGMKDINQNVQQLSTKVDRNEYENDNEAELYSSPFDSDPLDHFPAAPRSTTSTSSTSKTGSGSMSKSRWNLKLQLHSGGAQSASSLPAGSGASRSNPIHPHPHLSADDQFPRQAYPAASQGGHGPVLEGGQNPLPVSVDTDVYNHAYNYPLASQLSPIAEQDYVSPAADSESRSASLRFGRGGDGSMGKPSPGAESLVGSVFGGVSRKEKEKEPEKVSDVAERESVKTRPASVRTGSVGSVGTVNGNGNTRSRAGSTSTGVIPATGGFQNASPGGSIGSELTRPSPIYPLPFITRPLKRTSSQTSSDSQSIGQGPQPHVQTQTQTIQLSTGSAARPPATIGSHSTNVNGREIAQTPISAGTTTTPTGTMYTPTSTLQTPVTQTPISPAYATGAIPTIQLPSTAMTTGSLPAQGGSSGLPKIPSLPAIPPLELRFSLVGSSGPRVSTTDRTSNSGTNRKGLGKVERMPVIDGSVEGYYEEEDEDDEAEDVDDDENVEEEEEEEEYDRESLHADSFVTAGTNDDTSADKHNTGRHHLDPEIGVELATLGKHSRTGPSPTGSIHSSNPGAPASNSGSLRSLPATTLDPGSRGVPTKPGSTTGDSFIHRRWERDAALGFGVTSSSPTTFRAKGQNSRWPFHLFSLSSSSSKLTPAFWAFWLGFIFPVLWLVGGWHFTNAGELPPKSTMWEWYFWNSRWSVAGFRALMARVFGWCLGRKPTHSDPRKDGVVRGSQDGSVMLDQAQRRKGKRRSNSQSKARAGKVYPALPRWVAEKQSTDDGRMRLNDPKRSLRGISFGYPFISRPPGSQDSSGMMNPSSTVAPSSSGFTRVMRGALAILAKPNRALDLMYGVKLREVRGRPESGRRMFDPWIQRCRYALCYGLALLAVGLCTASAYLIVVNTRKLR